MKKIVLMMLLFASTNVLAEWTKVTKDSKGSSTLYVDIQSIRKNGNKVKMWTLFDYKTVQTSANVRFLSSLNRGEYDCSEETRRSLDFYWYSGNMKTGAIVYSAPHQTVQPKAVVPDSIDKHLLEVACGGK